MTAHSLHYTYSKALISRQSSTDSYWLMGFLQMIPVIPKSSEPWRCGMLQVSIDEDEQEVTDNEVCTRKKMKTIITTMP